MGCRFGTEGNVDQASFAIQGQFRLVPQNVGHAGVDAPVDGQVPRRQFFTEGYESGFADGGFFIRQNEEAHIVFLYQVLNFVHKVLWSPRPVLTPELPLGAEAAAEGATPSEVRHRHPDAEGSVDVFVPIQQRPIGS